jgi:hypothetical protein
MQHISPQLAQAIQTARVLLARERSERGRREGRNSGAPLWAGVSREGRIVVGTPLLRPGEGFYVDHTGHWTEA